MIQNFRHLLGLSAWLSLCSYMLWEFGVIPAWVHRNIKRVFVILIVLNLFVPASPGEKVFDILATIVLMRNWNWPNDNQPPRRRRRKKVQEEKKTGSTWTGTELPAPA